MKYNKQVYLGFDKNGKQRNKWFHADTKAELNAKILKYKMELEQVSNPSEITFAKYSEQWFTTYKANRSKQTQDMYKNALKKCQALEPFQIKKITKSMCQAVVNDSWFFPSAAEVLANTLKQVFKAAISDGIIASNPADMLSLPKKPKSRFHLINDKELEAIKNAKLNDDDRLFVNLLQIFGLRPAEALALQKTDFDFQNLILHITKAVELSNDNQGTLKDTKTGITREIPIPPALVSYLTAQFRRIKGFLLFSKTSGGPYTKSAYRRLSERILQAINEAAGGNKNMNLIPGFTLYAFRHRRATDLYYLCQQGVISTKQASALLGHSEMMFLKTYSHIDSNKENLANIYPDLLVENW